MYTVSQKKTLPFYFCDDFVRCHPILPILGRNSPREFESKHILRAHHTLLYMFALYLVKLAMIYFYRIQYIVKHEVAT